MHQVTSSSKPESPWHELHVNLFPPTKIESQCLTLPFRLFQMKYNLCHETEPPMGWNNNDNNNNIDNNNSSNNNNNNNKNVSS